MSESTMATRQREPLAIGALVAGILAAVVFFGLGFVTDADWTWLVALALAVVAIALGMMARRRRIAPSDQRNALIGLGLGAVVAAWFIIYMIVDAAL